VILTIRKKLGLGVGALTGLLLVSGLVSYHIQPIRTGDIVGRAFYPVIDPTVLVVW